MAIRMTNVLAIIPARAGSVGLPRKNVLPLEGKPLIAHTITAAKAAKLITRIVVSTDGDEIADVARAYGAEVIRRPQELAGPLSKSEDALLHVLDTLSMENYVPDVVVFLQCTSPLTCSEDMDGTIAEIIDGGADSALAVTAFHYFLWRHDSKGGAVGINHDSAERLMRQQRVPEYLETGAVYAMRTDGFRKSHHRFFGRIAMHEIPAERVLEIDEPSDFEIAKARFAAFRGELKTA